VKSFCASVLIFFALQSSASAQYIYSDDRIKLIVPAGWQIEKPIDPIVATHESDLLLRGYKVTLPGVELVRDHFIVFLLTHEGHSSGIRGGRFDEMINFVAPWIRGDRPTSCNPRQETTPVTDEISRVDLYLDTRTATQQAVEDCGAPSRKAVLWYGSFFTARCPKAGPDGEFPDCDGHFINYEALTRKPLTDNPVGDEMVFTLSFRTFNPDELPAKDDPALIKFLKDGTDVVKSIEFR
jgi:hypothetical protein